MIEIFTGDALEQIRKLKAESVQCCVTSPPYWGLRDYGTAEWEGGDAGCDHKSGRFERGGLSSKQASNTGSGGDEARTDCGKCGARRIDSQLGLERTPEEYVAKMVEIFREVRRVLRKDGTLWLNLGDSYASAFACDRRSVVGDGSPDENCKRPNRLSGGLKEKDLCGIPWRVAFALQADGWWLRSDIIWAKCNPMPESVTDRPTKAHEYLFLLTKSANYYYDSEAIKERSQIDEHGRYDMAQKGVRTGMAYLGQGLQDNSVKVRSPAGRKPHPKYSGSNGTSWNGHSGNMKADGTPISNGQRNKRSVWTVATAPYPEAHFATYPPDLVKPCILAGTSAKGCCPACAGPWERVVEREQTKEGEAYDSRMERWGNEFTPAHQGGRSFQVPIRYNISQSKAETLGWQPTCRCEWDNGGPLPHNTIPCTVLDPFAGSGTSGMVALELGRKAVLIELNPKYVQLIKDRCSVTPGLALA